uniref:PROP1-like PPR domain-containing protein n=1 Tax=Chromera velia CCMP2878 TaxID=1169474 RepID=A0A0G4FAB3_9ALVE|eukprot:Cvel_15998.t1-p1 / transcript=Cvel_15998.t1 / gene=Cvel_15998 / organism=Chromera_velia_CCMP2878 / gene_product=Pentatricopeptide repeat-containing protein, putative / transcript_product=Pentatricopeptide repeat-containing protein, putative / location=Cvel_scaffold1213:15572-25729(-) / protein_length=1095 / sequence_SO=supercontig / SO=protein_coding / is_pseudo=false
MSSRRRAGKVSGGSRLGRRWEPSRARVGAERASEREDEESDESPEDPFNNVLPSSFGSDRYEKISDDEWLEEQRRRADELGLERTEKEGTTSGEKIKVKGDGGTDTMAPLQRPVETITDFEKELADDEARRAQSRDLVGMAIKKGKMGEGSMTDLLGFDADKATEALAPFEAKGKNPATLMYNAALNTAERRGDFALASQIFEQMLKSLVPLDAISVQLVLSACNKANQADAGLLVWQRVREQGLPYDAAGLHAAVDLCGKAGDWEEALRILAEVRSQHGRKDLTPALYERVLSSLTNSNEFDKAYAVFREYLQSGLPLTVHALNSVLLCCERTGEAEHALEVWANSEGHVRPNVVTLDALIGVVGKTGYADVVSDIWSVYDKYKITKSTAAYSKAVVAFANCGDTETIVQLLQEMRSKKMKPSLMVCKAAIEAAREVGDAKLALTTLRLAKNLRYLPGIHLYNAVLAACAAAEDWAPMVTLGDQLKLEEQKGQSLLLQQRDKEKANFDEEQRRADEEEEPSSKYKKAAEEIWKNVEKEKPHEAALDEAKRSQGGRIVPAGGPISLKGAFWLRMNALTYHLLLTAFRALGLLREGRELIFQMQEKNVKPLATTRHLIDIFTEPGARDNDKIFGYAMKWGKRQDDRGWGDDRERAAAARRALLDQRLKDMSKDADKRSDMAMKEFLKSPEAAERLKQLMGDGDRQREIRDEQLVDQTRADLFKAGVLPSESVAVDMRRVGEVPSELPPLPNTLQSVEKFPPNPPSPSSPLGDNMQIAAEKEETYPRQGEEMEGEAEIMRRSFTPGASPIRNSPERPSSVSSLPSSSSSSLTPGPESSSRPSFSGPPADRLLQTPAPLQQFPFNQREREGESPPGAPTAFSNADSSETHMRQGGGPGAFGFQGAATERESGGRSLSPSPGESGSVNLPPWYRRNLRDVDGNIVVSRSPFLPPGTPESFGASVETGEGGGGRHFGVLPAESSSRNAPPSGSLKESLSSREKPSASEEPFDTFPPAASRRGQQQRQQRRKGIVPGDGPLDSWGSSQVGGGGSDSQRTKGGEMDEMERKRRMFEETIGTSSGFSGQFKVPGFGDQRGGRK